MTVTFCGHRKINQTDEFLRCVRCRIYSWGGAVKTLEFAQRKKKVIFQYPTRVGKE